MHLKKTKERKMKTKKKRAMYWLYFLPFPIYFPFHAQAERDSSDKRDCISLCYWKLIVLTMPEPSLTQEQEAEILQHVFYGKLDHLPTLASKIVRIFTSSTFTGEHR